MSVRHPVLLGFWAAVFVLTGFGLSNPSWFIIVFLVSPFAALATLAAVISRVTQEPLRAGWGLAYRAAAVLLAGAALLGVIMSSAGMVSTDGGRSHFENGPLGVLFLITFVTAWKPAARPTPRQAAIPAVVVHLSWLPLLIMNAMSHYRYVQSDSQRTLTGACLIVILAGSAIVSALGLVSFAGEPKIAPARAV